MERLAGALRAAERPLLVIGSQALLQAGQAAEIAAAVERIGAAADAARGLKDDFVLVARADGVMNGHYDMDEALRRIRAFDAAGADCLYVPVPPSLEDLKAVIAATDKPVNVLMVGPFTKMSRADMADLGAARLSLGSALARATHRLIADASEGMFKHGDFTALGKTISGAVVDEMLSCSKA